MTASHEGRLSWRLRLAVFTSHPIQYQMPWFRALAEREDLDLTVHYVMLPTREQQGAGFGRAFSWDLPLLEGYRWRRLRNVAPRPSLVTFGGCAVTGLLPLLRRGRYDAVVANGWGNVAMLQVLVACRLTGTPCVVRGESNGLEETCRWRGVRRIGMRGYSAVLAIGEANRRYYEALGYPASRILMARYGVDNERFAREAAARRTERESLRRRWGARGSETLFLLSGKLEAKKRPLEVIDAVARAAESADVRLLVVGDGPLREECEARVALLGAPVTFAGFLNQSEIAAAYVACDVLVLASDYGETWGLVVNEAMACGRPAIVSDRVGCGPDLVVEGVTGHRFPFGETEALARVMVRMARNPEGRARMGVAAREHVAEYGVDQVVDGVLDAARRVRRR